MGAQRGRLRKRYLSCELMERRGTLERKRGAEASEIQEENCLNFEGCLCSVVSHRVVNVTSEIF